MERIDKHPFQLSRVYYDGKEKGEQARRLVVPLSLIPRADCQRLFVTSEPLSPRLAAFTQAWVEPSDRSCRWTQTSSELTVLVLKARCLLLSRAFSHPLGLC